MQKPSIIHQMLSSRQSLLHLSNWSPFFLFPEEGYVKMYLKGRPITMFMPKDQVDGYCLEARADLPASKLKLDWVYPFLKKQKNK